MVDRCEADVISTRPWEAEKRTVKIGQADEPTVWRTDAKRLITFALKNEAALFLCERTATCRTAGKNGLFGKAGTDPPIAIRLAQWENLQLPGR